MITLDEQIEHIENKLAWLVPIAQIRGKEMEWEKSYEMYKAILASLQRLKEMEDERA